MSSDEPDRPTTDPWPPPAVAPPPPPPPPYGGQQPPYGQQQYGQAPYGYQPYGPPPQTEGSAVGALVASIIAWVICPIIPAIVSLVMIPGAKRKIDGSQGRLTGEGLLTAAKWISWINIALWGLMIIGFGILIVIGVASESSTSSDFSLGAVLRG